MIDEFDRLLTETGITFVPPAGFAPFPVRQASTFRYQRAYRHATGVEVRFRIDSLQRIKADMGGFLPANFSDTAFVSGIVNLSGGQVPATQQWNADQARRYFRADWVRCAYFRLGDPQFAPDHDLAVVHYFHRNDVADVYLIGLYKQGVGGCPQQTASRLGAGCCRRTQGGPEDRTRSRRLDFCRSSKLTAGGVSVSADPAAGPEPHPLRSEPRLRRRNYTSPYAGFCRVTGLASVAATMSAPPIQSCRRVTSPAKT